MTANTHNGPNILPLKDRTSPGRLAARQLKKQDRADFRLRTVRTFEEIGRGMGIFDAAIATTYSRGKRFILLQLLVDIAIFAYLWYLGGHLR